MKKLILASIASAFARDDSTLRFCPSQRSPWKDFYQQLAVEARERAAQAKDPSVKAAFEEVAEDWSELAEWVEQRREKGAA